MKNILFISNYLEKNGTEMFMMNVLRFINKLEFHIDFLIFSDKTTDYSIEAEKLGAHVYRLPPRKSSFCLYIKCLDSFFKINARKYNVVHFCGGNLSTVAPIYFAYRYRIPIRIVHSHSSKCDGLHNWLLHCINRFYVKRFATCNIACSQYAARWFFGKTPCLIIKNGINIASFRYNVQTRRQIRKECDIQDNMFVLGHVGRFVKVKNHAKILHVFKAYLAMNQNAKLCLVGDGELINDMKDLAVSLGIDNNVQFLGERNDVSDLMQMMDLFIMPSLFEGLPFVLVEAQTAGLPCLVSDNINKDIKITDLIHFKNINDKDSDWAKAIDNIRRSYIRTSTDQQVIDAGYSIVDSVKELEKVYSQKL